MFSLLFTLPRPEVFRACSVALRCLIGAFVVASAAGPTRAALQPEVPAPLRPLEAAASMIVPSGFNVTLFAGEPDVRQPIAFCIDDRGRLWVAEAFNYPKHGLTPGDRIVIFEDTDHDGRFDKRTVFCDVLNYISGIEVGFGGVWVMSPPSFYFIPDRDGDDRPDGPPQVLLDGFGTHSNSHNIANAFAWGPDGWLYGTHGRTNWSLMGKPGTPKDKRVRFDGGVWRYHPVRHVWEPFADGSTNPWGIDWDDYGQAFTSNSVDPHVFHMIQGAHYEPWRNRESSLYAYERIPTIADHLHFVGKGRVQDGLGSAEENDAGGGHAHCGPMIYLGDNWPVSFRNTLLLHNIHGRRINHDILWRSGSGYVATHAADFLRSRDPWFMGVSMRYGPDGSVYSLDWSDTGECHSVRNTHKDTGRIYRIAYGTPQWPDAPIGQLEDGDLVERQLHRNDWHVRHARRLLQERAAEGKDMSAARAGLARIFSGNPDITRKLRALWALHVIGGADESFLSGQLQHENEYVRAWAVQLLCEQRRPSSAALARFQEMAAQDSSPLVRLYLAAALQRLEFSSRRPIAEALARRGEDAHDQNVPLMAWYGIEPLVEDRDDGWFVSLAVNAKMPVVRRHIARRLTEKAKSGEELDPLVRLLAQSRDPAIQGNILEGLLAGLESQGLRNPGLPPSWSKAYAVLNKASDDMIRAQARQLALVFDDPVALAEVRRQAADSALDAEKRRESIRALVAKKPRDLPELLFQLLMDAATAGAAARGLAAFDHPDTATRLLSRFGELDGNARQDAIYTLASRRVWAAQLLLAVESQQIPRRELTAFTARQLASLGDPAIKRRVEALWGELRDAPATKAKQIIDYSRMLTPPAIAAADRSAGRKTFEKLCATCHRLFDAGGEIGPDLTGAQRNNLDYLLENIVYPSAAVSRDYQLQIIETTGGRTVSGFVVAENQSALTVRSVNELIVVRTSEIVKRTVAPVSMMPEGLLQGLSPRELQELVAYIAGANQVPITAPARAL